MTRSPSIPCALAWRMTKLYGRKSPQKTKNSPKAVDIIVGSLIPRMYSLMSTGFLSNSSRDLTVTQAMVRSNKNINPTARIAQGKPTRSINLGIMIGRTIPPTDDPDIMMPKAKARRRWNQLTRHDMLALVTALAPMGQTMLWERKK